MKASILVYPITEIAPTLFPSYFEGGLAFDEIIPNEI